MLYKVIQTPRNSWNSLSDTRSLFVPFKFSISSLEYPMAVKYAGLIYDLMLFTKKTFDDFKKSPNSGNVILRIRLKNGKEFIISQGNKYNLF